MRGGVAVLLVVIVALARSATAAEADHLSEDDRRVLKELREGVVDEVGGFDEGKGQPHSLLLTFKSGMRAVCKNGRRAYGKMDQLVNEVFAFYLDRLLRVGHVPPATISEFSGFRFREVRDRAIVKQQWQSGDPLVCSQYHDDAVPAVWPQVLRKQVHQINVVTGEKQAWSEAERKEAELWGQVIAFDFLTGNSERLANSLNSAPKAKRPKNTLSLSSCRHSDCRVDNTFFGEKGQLILVDNNSGFYFEKMNSLMDPLTWHLEDTCIFPAKFVRELLSKKNGADLRSELAVLVNKNEPEGPMQNGIRIKAFQMRFQALMEHLRLCQQNHNNRISFF